MKLEKPFCPRCKSYLKMHIQNSQLQCSCEPMYLNRKFYSVSGVIINVYNTLIVLTFPSLNLVSQAIKITNNEYKVTSLYQIKDHKIYNIENLFDPSNSVNEIITYIFKFKNNEIFQ